MRIISFNAEGIISAESKGFFSWIRQQDADIICIQDLQARENNLQSDRFHIEGYHPYFFENFTSTESHPPGGVAIYTRTTPKAIIMGTGIPIIDNEGRYIQADFNNISISSLLVPGSVNCLDQQEDKYAFLDAYLLFLKKQSRKRREVITCGTFNIAHTKNDVFCYEDNKNRSGALVEEQRWMNLLLSSMNYADCFQKKQDEGSLFTFWENNVNRENNDGWRIDYQIVTQNIKPKVSTTNIYTYQQFSRHAPVVVDYEWDLTM